MTFKNIDVILSRNLTAIVPTEQILFSDRVSTKSNEEGIPVDTRNLIKIIRAFISNKRLTTLDELSPNVVEAFKSFMMKQEDDITIKDLEELFSRIKYFEHNFRVIGRLDINDEPIELSIKSKVAYLIDNFKNNDTKCSGFYTGYAKSYETNDTPLAMDFINLFNLSEEDINNYDLSVVTKSYELFQSTDELNKFDDSLPQSFMKSRGMQFIVGYYI